MKKAVFVKKTALLAAALTMGLTFAGCGGETRPAPASSEISSQMESAPADQEGNQAKLTPEQASEALDKIYIAPPENVPAPSCGIVLPAGIPAEYVEMKAAGVLKESGETVDLMEGKEVIPDEWIVFEELEKYSEAECTISIVWDGTIYGTGTIDLLDDKAAFRRPEGEIFPQNV